MLVIFHDFNDMFLIVNVFCSWFLVSGFWSCHDDGDYLNERVCL